MSRLDSFIRRLEAQRLCLDWAVSSLDAPGAVLELGLGNGRTYDHLRERIAGGRPIYAFDRHLAAHPACVPPAETLCLGELRETLPAFAAKRVPVALAHADLGSGDAAATAALAAWLGPMLARVVGDGGLVLSDQPLDAPQLRRVEPPAGVPADRYFVYRRG
ncbi:MAG: hypothetical protein JNK67_25730 [Alphaproteobacteria bacterium]|nr:hypothetical protein [Alphaproteobacteria bacterium]